MRWLLVALMAWEGAAFGASQMTMAIQPFRTQGVAAEIVKQVESEVANELDQVKEVTVVTSAADAKAGKKCGTDQLCLAKFGKSAKASQVLFGEVKPAGRNHYLVSIWMLNTATGKAVESDSETVGRDDVVREARRQVVKLVTPERVLGQVILVGPATTRVILNGRTAKMGERYLLVPGSYSLESLPSGASSLTRTSVEVKYGQTVTARFARNAARPVETRAPWVVPMDAKRSTDIPAKPVDTRKAIAALSDTPVTGSLLPAKADEVTNPGGLTATDGALAVNTQPPAAGMDETNAGMMNEDALPLPPAATATERVTTSNPMRKVAYAALITGGAIMTVGLVQQLRANSFRNDIDNMGSTIPLSQRDSARSKYDSFKTANVTGWVFLGVGAAATLYGGGYLIFAPSTSGGQVTFSGSF